MLLNFVCKIAGHRVNRRRVWHDSVDFRTSCERCNTPLIRDEKKGWRPFDEERDFAPERSMHPH